MAITVGTRVRHVVSALVGAGILLGALVAAPGAAQAAEQSPRACNYDIGTKTTTCVGPGEDLDAAVYRQQGIRVLQPGSKAAVAKTLAPATVVVISDLYENANYGGAMIQITWTHGCNGSDVFYFDGISLGGLGGKVSSFQSFGSCQTKLWKGRYSGASYGYAVAAASLGSMNDQATTATIK